MVCGTLLVGWALLSNVQAVEWRKTAEKEEVVVLMSEECPQCGVGASASSNGAPGLPLLRKLGMTETKPAQWR